MKYLRKFENNDYRHNSVGFIKDKIKLETFVRENEKLLELEKKKVEKHEKQLKEVQDEIKRTQDKLDKLEK
jgi:hypothetical protein